MRTRLALLLALAAAVMVLATAPEPQPVDVVLEPQPVDHVREGDVRFKTTCNFDHAAADDPIVYPGQPGASHLHDFTGRVGITASTTTYAELIKGRTTCNDHGDRAGYWTPSVYVNGVQAKPTRMTAYYRRGNKHGTIEAYPAGLKIIAGHSMSDPSSPTGLTGWQCDEVRPPRSTPDGCSGEVVVRIGFPDCWDGVNLDTADHRSHMAYSTHDAALGANACPPTHPVQVPALATHTHYSLPPGGRVTGLSSGDLTTGVHGDFFNGWEIARLAERVETCLNGYQTCPSGG